MGFSVTNPTSGSSLLAELQLAQGQGASEADGLTPPEVVDPEGGEDPSTQGFLRGEAKSYTFIPQEGGKVLQTFVEYLTDINRPSQQKSLDSKTGDHHLSFKENLIRVKELKVTETTQQKADGKDRGEGKSSVKILDTAHSALAKAALPASARQLRETPAIKQQQTQAKTLEHRIRHELKREESARPHTESSRKNSESKKQTKESERERETAQPRMERSDKNEEKEQRQHKRKRDDEEGFAEGNREGNQQHSPEDEKRRNKTEKIDENFAKEFASYAAEESILSQIFQMRVSQFDVLILFIEILKIDIRSREQEKLARRKERELQLLHMQNIVDNYKTQGKWLMMSSLGAGILSIVSGIAPIAGHMNGPWILQKLGSIPFFSGLRDMDSNQFFKGVTKITMAMSEMQKSTGQIHNTFAEGNRTFDQHMSDLHRTDWEENTRSIEEIKDNWKGIENFLYQALQMYHDSIRQLYSH